MAIDTRGDSGISAPTIPAGKGYRSDSAVNTAENTGFSSRYGTSTGDVALGMEALLSGRVWNGTRGEAVRLAYHFAEAGGLPDYYNSWSRRDGFTPFDEGQREAARSALAAWAEAGGVRFEEVDDPTGAQIVFGITELAEGAAGFAFYPGAGEGATFRSTETPRWKSRPAVEATRSFCTKHWAGSVTILAGKRLRCGTARGAVQSR